MKRIFFYFYEINLNLTLGELHKGLGGGLKSKSVISESFGGLVEVRTYAVRAVHVLSMYRVCTVFSVKWAFHLFLYPFLSSFSSSFLSHQFTTNQTESNRKHMITLKHI